MGETASGHVVLERAEPPVLEWPNRACLDMGHEIFYPERDYTGGRPSDRIHEPALRVCNGHGRIPPCPHRAACLIWAVQTEQRWGVWGGTTPLQRERLIDRYRARKDMPRVQQEIVNTAHRPAQMVVTPERATKIVAAGGRVHRDGRRRGAHTFVVDHLGQYDEMVDWQECAHRADYVSAADHERNCPYHNGEVDENGLPIGEVKRP